MLKRSLIISTVLISCLLQACVGAFIAGTAIGGVVVYEGRNLSTQKTDMRFASNAKKALSSYPELENNSRVVVSSYNGVILLVGQTPTPELRRQAGEIVEAAVPQAKKVYNEITINGPISSITQSSDTWITTKVKSHLLTIKNLDSSQIKVVTENGSVFLLGKVTHQQGQTAANAARKVAGVQKVVTLFEYTD